MSDIGDLVMLKSGGPYMTVIDLGRPDSEQRMLVCAWYGKSAVSQRAAFPENCLRPAGMEEVNRIRELERELFEARREAENLRAVLAINHDKMIGAERREKAAQDAEGQMRALMEERLAQVNEEQQREARAARLHDRFLIIQLGEAGRRLESASRALEKRTACAPDGAPLASNAAEADMTKVDPKKLGALVDKQGKKKMPPKKPGGGGGPPSQHHKEEAEHEGDTPEEEQKEHEQGGGDGDAELDRLVAEQGERVQNGDGDEELMALTEGYDPEEHGNPPSWVEDEDTWEKAKKAVKKYWDNYDEPWAVVAHVYDAMGGSKSSGGGEDGGGEE